MSRELRCQYPTASSTLYAVARRLSDDYVFNGTAFVAWADADVATYDLPLTERGGDTYSADIPGAIVAGDYYCNFYVQAGTTPSISDLLIPGFEFHWDGTAASSVSTENLSDYALASLADLKTYLGITGGGSDTLLTQVINRVSAKIETITGRKFKARDYRLRLNGNHERRICLPYYPVQSVTRIAYGNANAISVTFTGSGIRANASVYKDPELPDGGGMRLVSISTAGAKTATTLAFSTYASVSTLVTAINLVSGWHATTLTNIPTGDLHATGATNVLNLTGTFTYPDRDTYAYTIDHDKGILEFDNGIWGNDFRNPFIPRTFPVQFQGVLIETRLGFETLPADVNLVCLELCKEVYLSRQQNTALKSSALGPYSVTFRDNQISRVREELAHYIDASRTIGGAT